MMKTSIESLTGILASVEMNAEEWGVWGIVDTDTGWNVTCANTAAFRMLHGVITANEIGEITEINELGDGLRFVTIESY